MLCEINIDYCLQSHVYSFEMGFIVPPPPNLRLHYSAIEGNSSDLKLQQQKVLEIRFCKGVSSHQILLLHFFKPLWSCTNNVDTIQYVSTDSNW